MIVRLPLSLHLSIATSLELLLLHPFIAASLYHCVSLSLHGCPLHLSILCSCMALFIAASVVIAASLSLHCCRILQDLFSARESLNSPSLHGSLYRCIFRVSIFILHRCLILQDLFSAISLSLHLLSLAASFESLSLSHLAGPFLGEVASFFVSVRALSWYDGEMSQPQYIYSRRPRSIIHLYTYLLFRENGEIIHSVRSSQDDTIA
jgi:hypothetical protein